MLEESSALGGISRTVVHGDCRIDIGGHRFFSKSKEVNDLWTRLMPIQGSPAKDDILLHRSCHVEAGGPDPERVDRVMLRRRRISRIYYLRHFFDYPISVYTVFGWTDKHLPVRAWGPDAVFDAEEQAVRILGQTGGGRMRCVSLHARHDHLLALPHARPVGGDGNHRLPVVLFPSCHRLSACARGRYALVCDGHLRQAHLHPAVGGADFGSHADPERRLVEEGDDDAGLWTGACRLLAPVDGAQQACVRNGGIDNDFGHEPLCVQLGASGRTAAVRRESEGTGVHEEI